jgi:stage II sporulation protein D
MMFVATSYASDSDIEIRVRIREPRNTNEQVDLQGYGNINMYNILESKDVPIAVLEQNLKVFLDTYYNNNYLVQDSKSSEAVIGPYHLKLIDKEYVSYNEALDNAKKLAANYSINFYPFYNGKSFNIYAGNFINEAEASKSRDNLIANGISSETVNGLNQFVIVLNSINSPVLMYANNFNIYYSTFNNDLNCNSIKIDGRVYKGEAAFSISDVRLLSINKVSLKNYLYGVLPREIFTTWPAEVIKAQALTARSYAVASLKPNSKTGYDVEDNQNDQVYGGYSAENPITNAIVDSTDGQKIYHDGKVIMAYFHSTSGGRTENTENIWVIPIPYLKAVEDPFSENTPLATWKRTVTKEEAIKNAKEINPNVTDVYNIVITEVSENGRVMQCIISTDAGDIILKKSNITATFGYRILPSTWFSLTSDCDVYLISENSFIAQQESGHGDSVLDDSSSSSGSLSSSDDSILDKDNPPQDIEKNTDIEKINPDDERVSLNNKYIISSSGISNINNSSLSFISSTGVSKLSTVPTSYYFDGKGNGHGIGMSQYGAKKMAEEGYTYEQIIKHYYTGVEIR